MLKVSLLVALCAAYVLANADFLNPHNAARASVNPAASPPLQPLVWDTGLAATAQAYADSCPTGHSGNGYGENLYWSYPSGNAAAAIGSWVAEEANYNYNGNSCSGVCGHYTQVVWANTQRVGCGVAVGCQSAIFGGLPHTAIVCNYDPPGNYIGQLPYQASSTSSRSVRSLFCDETCDNKCGEFNSKCGSDTYTCECAADSVCVQGECCTPNYDVCPEEVCGMAFNGCEYVDCGGCDSGVCSGNVCVDANEVGCVPTTCEAFEDSVDPDGSFYECGSIDNGCGAVIECGTCQPGSVCRYHECVPSACAGGCGLNQVCNEDLAVCECIEGHQEVGPNNCRPFPSGASNAVQDWQVVLGDPASWRSVGDELQHEGTDRRQALRWATSTNLTDDDMTMAARFAGLRAGDSASVGLRYNFETNSSMEMEVRVTNNGKANGRLCTYVFGERHCHENSCEVDFPTDAFSLISVRQRKTVEGIEIGLSVNGYRCPSYNVIPAEFPMWNVRGDAYIGVKASEKSVVRVRKATLVTTTTLTVSLSQCMSEAQWVEYLQSVLQIPRENINVIDLGDEADCGSRKREVVGGVGAGITFELIGTSAVKSSALSAQLSQLVVSGAPQAAAAGGGISGASAVTGVPSSAAGAGGLGGSAALVAAGGAGGGGGGGGGITTGGIVALSVALPLTAVVLVAMAVGVTGGAYHYSKNGARGGGDVTPSTPDEPAGRRSISQRVLGFFGVKVMGGDGQVHQSITARSPPVKV